MGSAGAPLLLAPAPASAPAGPQVLLSRPRGFCAGVVRAIDIVEQALALHGAPVHVLHEIVHNGQVVADLRSRGAVFVDRLDEVPDGAVLIFSAHGVARAVARQARERGLLTIDATCPLVAKVHLQAQRYVREGRALVIIGHREHAEVQGTLGAVDVAAAVLATPDEVARLPHPNATRMAYVTQTTLSVDDTREVIAALAARYADLQGPDTDDICYATQNRQNATRELAAQVQLVLVVGARHSSNACRLREVAAQQGVAAHLVQDASEIDPAWLTGVRQVGVTAGASTPEVLVTAVRARLAQLGAGSVRELAGTVERVNFRMPLIQRPAAPCPAGQHEAWPTGGSAA